MQLVLYRLQSSIVLGGAAAADGSAAVVAMSGVRNMVWLVPGRRAGLCCCMVCGASFWKQQWQSCCVVWAVMWYMCMLHNIHCT